VFGLKKDEYSFFKFKGIKFENPTVFRYIPLQLLISPGSVPITSSLTFVIYNDITVK